MLRFLTRRFTLSGLLFIVAALPICMGVVAAVEFTAWDVAGTWIGIDWWNAARQFLLDDVGLSADFVARYVTFALHDIAAWVCYCIIALALGIFRHAWAQRSGVVFLVSIILYDLLADYHSGLHHLLNLRLVSLFGVLLATICFLAGRKLPPALPAASPRKPSRLCLATWTIGIAAILAMSIYGWWLIEIGRQAGLEVQKLFQR